MRKQLLGTILAAAIPLAAAAQGGPPAAPQGPQPGMQQGGANGPRFSPEKMEKRMRLARTLGLAEALDLDAPAALKLGDTIGKFDDRRVAAHKQMHEAREVLRRAAQGEKLSAADVDGAIQKGLDARAQLTAIDRETVAAVTQGLTPEKKARAVLFLARFQHRFAGHMMGPGMGPGGGPGMHRGMGPGMGPGRRGPGRGGPGGDLGMGPGPEGPMNGMAMGPQPGDFFDDEPED
jgi:hypothetical protein